MGAYVVRVSKVQSVNQLYGAVVANLCCESNMLAWPVLDGRFERRQAGGGRCRCGCGGCGGRSRRRRGLLAGGEGQRGAVGAADPQGPTGGRPEQTAGG